MPSQSDSTVAYYVRQINNEVFLPGLQREFVWDPSEIIDLFDSLIRGYPIGAIVYWDVKTLSGSFTSYEFLQYYLSDKGAIKITPTFGDKTYAQSNERVSPDNCRRLIVDGQQRLNSLFIGLTGSILRYTEGSKGSRSTKEHWSEMELCINVLGHPQGPDSDSDYEFAFQHISELSTPDLEGTAGYIADEKLDFIRCKHEKDEDGDIGEIWVSLPSLFKESEYQQDARVSELPQTERGGLIRQVMMDFESNVLNHGLSEDVYQGPAPEVKTVFQRLNTKGQTPKQYQLLMSKMMSSWPFGEDACYPREEIVEALQELRTDFDEFNALIDRQLILRYLGYLCNTELRKKDIESLGQHGDDRLKAMKSTWQDWEKFKGGLRKALKTATELGFTDATFDSAPIIALVARYYYESGEEVSTKNKDAILRFLSLSILLDEAYDIKRRSKARKMSNRVGSFNEDESFPTERVLKAANIYPTREIIADFVTNARYEVNNTDDRSVFRTDDVAAVLGLLSDTFDTKELDEYDIDHIFPQAKEGIVQSAQGSENEVEIHRIGNLQLLRQAENRSRAQKGDKLPSKWVSSVSTDFRRTLVYDHLYPATDESTEALVEALSPDEYKSFVKKRENNIIDALVADLVDNS